MKWKIIHKDRCDSETEEVHRVRGKIVIQQPESGIIKVTISKKDKVVTSVKVLNSLMHKLRTL